MKISELKTLVDRMKRQLPQEAAALLDLLVGINEQQEKQISQLHNQIIKLEARIKAYEDKQATNSNNSSKPPSQDINRSPKKRSMRIPSGKKPGGQPGHPGSKSQLKDDPDETIKYIVSHCPDCKEDLSGVEADAVIRKQVEDLPPVKTIVVEHQIEVKTCPCCHKQWEARCEIKPEYSYGPRIKSMAVYLSLFQFVPQGRVQALFALWGVKLSQGSLNNFRSTASAQMEDFERAIKAKLLSEKALHFDETGIKVNGKNHWVHSASSKTRVLYIIDPHRGRKAHEKMGVLSQFTGIAHSDGYKAYQHYAQNTPSLCCAHIIRELKFAIERNGQQSWAQPLLDLLIAIKKRTEATEEKKVSLWWKQRYLCRYNRLIKQGLALNPALTRPPDQKSGKVKQSKTHNLLIRLRDRRDDVLRFMTESEAEFDNNQAERDLRMNKVRAKVSGGFRSKTAADEFMRIRSLVATAIKQSICPLDALMDIFSNTNTTLLRLTN